MRRAIDSVTNKVLPEVSEHLVVANQADAIGDLRATMKQHLSERGNRDSMRYLNKELLHRRDDRGYERRYFLQGGTRGQRSTTAYCSAKAIRGSAL